MGEVVAFPRKAPRPGYTAAQLDRARETVEHMMARGVSEDEAYEIAVIQMRLLNSHGN